MKIYQNIPSPFYYVIYSNPQNTKLQFEWSLNIINAASYDGYEELWLSDIFLIQTLRTYLMNECSSKPLDIMKTWLNKIAFGSLLCTPYIWQGIIFCEHKNDVRQIFETLCLPNSNNISSIQIKSKLQSQRYKHIFAYNIPSILILEPKLDEISKKEYINSLNLLTNTIKNCILLFSAPYYDIITNKSYPALPPLISIPLGNWN